MKFESVFRGHILNFPRGQYLLTPALPPLNWSNDTVRDPDPKSLEGLLDLVFQDIDLKLLLQRFGTMG